MNIEQLVFLGVGSRRLGLVDYEIKLSEVSSVDLTSNQYVAYSDGYAYTIKYLIGAWLYITLHYHRPINFYPNVYTGLVD